MKKMNANKPEKKCRFEKLRLNFWFVALIAFIFGIFCYWSDWMELFNFPQASQKGKIIKDFGRALLVSAFLGFLFRNKVLAIIFGFILPSLIVRQIDIFRHAAPNTNLLPLVVGAEILLNLLLIVAVLTVAIVSRWGIRKWKRNSD